jgi:hypothetical protein
MPVRIDRNGDTYVAREGDSVKWTRELALDMSGTESREELVWEWAGVVAVAGGPTIYLLDAESGATKKVIELDGDLFRDLSVPGDALYVLGRRHVVAIGRDLEVRWRSKDIAMDGIVWRAGDVDWILISAEMDPPGTNVDVELDASTGHEIRRGTVVAHSECGNYGEDALIAWQLGDDVEIEHVAKGGVRKQWRVARGDTLRVTGDVWGHSAMVGMNTDLVLITSRKKHRIAHFEFSFVSGGPTDDEVAKLARAIGTASGCAVDVVPRTFPASAVTVASTPPPEPPRPAEAPSPPPPRLPPLVGASLLASVMSGNDTDEPLHAFSFFDGSVVIENSKTATRWTITRADTLVITAYAAGGRVDRVWTCLERKPDERIAGFYNDPSGADEAAVAAFVDRIASVTGCTVNHRPFCWD